MTHQSLNQSVAKKLSLMKACVLSPTPDPCRDTCLSFDNVCVCVCMCVRGVVLQHHKDLEATDRWPQWFFIREYVTNFTIISNQKSVSNAAMHNNT